VKLAVTITILTSNAGMCMEFGCLLCILWEHVYLAQQKYQQIITIK